MPMKIKPADIKWDLEPCHLVEADEFEMFYLTNEHGICVSIGVPRGRKDIADFIFHAIGRAVMMKDALLP